MPLETSDDLILSRRRRQLSPASHGERRVYTVYDAIFSQLQFPVSASALLYIYVSHWLHYSIRLGVSSSAAAAVWAALCRVFSLINGVWLTTRHFEFRRTKLMLSQALRLNLHKTEFMLLSYTTNDGLFALNNSGDWFLTVLAPALL